MLKQAKNELKSLKFKSIQSVFIGGGTPSCMDGGYYEEFFEFLKPYLAHNAEITSEANPNSASKQWLCKMKALGVNRISFGVQSFFDDKLKFLGRAHRGEEAKRAVFRAKDAGFENISLDLIYATKYDDEKRLDEDIKTALDLGIEHISAYSLTLEEGTPFFGKDSYVNNDFTLGEFVAKRLVDGGFEWYEVSNFGKKSCRHNLGYWRHENYLGIGSGAVGFLNDKRFYPSKDVKKYIQNPLFVDVEHLSEDELLNEKIFLGLRSKIGVDGDILSDKQIQKANILVDGGKLIRVDGVYYCQDFFLADEIYLTFFSH